MGNICDCLKCLCCCGAKKLEKKPKTPPNEFNSDIEDDTEEKEFISEEKLKAEAIKGIKGGDTSYASLRGLQQTVASEEKEMELVRRYGSKIGLQIIGVCGSGSYSQVYKVFSVKNHKFYALKVMNHDKSNNEYIKNHLDKEVDILKRIPRHKNIVKVKSFRKHWNRIWIVMELAERGTLTEHIRDYGAMTESLAQKFIIQILDGVNELHIKNIAHRDLKLENILMSAKYVPKISDFSYSIEVNPNSPLSDQYCGTLPYFSPELLQRKPYHPLKSDIWSLGVCFFVILNDGLPFKIEKDDDSIMLQKQLNKDWKFRQRVESLLSRDIKDVIISMLEPDPELRPQTQKLKSIPWFSKQNLI